MSVYEWTIDKARRKAAAARVWHRTAKQLVGSKRVTAEKLGDAEHLAALRLGREAARIRQVTTGVAK